MPRFVRVLVGVLALLAATSVLHAQRRPIRRPMTPPAEPARKPEPAAPASAPGELPPHAEVRLGDNAFRVFGHRMAYSSDGALLAVADHATVAVLDAVTGLTRRSLVHRTKDRPDVQQPMPQAVVDMVFFADNKRLLTGEEAGVVRIWDLEKGTETMLPTLHLGMVALSLAADQKHFVSAGIDGTLRRWSVGDLKELDRWEEPKKAGLIAVSQRNGKVFTVNREGTFYEWDPQTNAITRTFELGAVRFSEVRSDIAAMYMKKDGRAQGDLQTAKRNVVFSPDGAWLLQQQGHQMWDTATGKAIYRIKSGEQPAAISFAPDSEFVAVARSNEPAAVYGVSSGVLLREVSGLPAFAIALSRGAAILAATRPQQVLRCQLATLTHDTSGSGIGEVDDWDISADGERLVFATRERGVRFFDAVKGVALADPQPPIPADLVQFHPDGRTLVVGVAGQQPTSGLFHYHFDGRNWVRAKSLQARYDRARGRFLPINRGREFGPPSLGYVDTFTGKQFQLHRGGANPPPQHISISADGRFVVAEVEVPGKSGRAAFGRFGQREYRVMTLPDMSKIRKIEPGKSDRAPWIFSPDGRLMVQLGTPLRVLEVRGGGERGTFRIDSTCPLEFSPDGRSLLSGTADGRVAVHDLIHGTELFRSGPAHGGRVREIRTTPAGKLVSVGEDHTFVVWSEDLWRRPTSAKRTKVDPEDLELFFNLLKQPGASNIGPTMQTLIDGGDEIVRWLDAKMLREPGSASDAIRTRRCVEVLEHIGTTNARKLLRRLSAGPAESLATQEARESLDRLARH